MALTGARSPRWVVEQLDQEDNPIGTLAGWLPSSSLEINATTRLGGSATLALRDTGTPPDFLTARCRIQYDPGTGDAPMDWGVWLLTSPTLQVSGGRRVYQVQCATKLLIIDRDGLIDGVTYPAGTPIVDTVVDLIRSTGETRIAATPTDAALSSPMTFDAGESKLTVINKLLEAAAYWGLWVDTSGVFRVEAWTAPKDRQPAWDFVAGAVNLARPDWSREQNLSDVPNRVVCRTRGDDETPGIVGVAENASGNAFSIANRGVVQRTYDVEADSQAAANALAAMYLENAMSPVLKVSVEHAVVPLQRNDVVIFQPTGAEPEAFTVQSMRIQNLSFDAHVDATWRGVDPRESGPASEPGGEA